MTLSLVIPARGDENSLVQLLSQATGTVGVGEVVVVDDCSDPPLDLGRLARAAGPLPLTLDRLPRAQGAGAARNRGLDLARCEHLLFFDADDRLGPEISPLWREIAPLSPDLCLFRHIDSRYGRQMPADEALWQRAHPVGALSPPLDEPRRAVLAQTANYPWNKIYRTAFLRENMLRCSETLVHNDIALHWESLAAADDMRVSDRIGAVHHVSTGGKRLTNRASAARLGAFVPLDRLASRFCARPSWITLPFLRWTVGFLDWLRGNLEADLHPRLNRRMGHFAARHLSPDLIAYLARADPILARDLLTLWARGRTEWA